MCTRAEKWSQWGVINSKRGGPDIGRKTESVSTRGSYREELVDGYDQIISYKYETSKQQIKMFFKKETVLPFDFLFLNIF